MFKQRILRFGIMVLVCCLGINPLLFGALDAAMANQVGVTFQDLTGHWAAASVQGWIDSGLVQGYPNGRFGPDLTIARAELIAIINRTFGLNQQEKVQYQDVKAASWYYGEVAKANAVGYISGFGDGNFRPEAPVTRQEAAAIIAKLLKLDISNTGDQLSSFKDQSKAAPWARSYLNSVIKHGYLDGYPDGTLRPNGPVTRAEAVVMLQRLSGRLFTAAGNYGQSDNITTVSGNATVTQTGITLQNTVIEGDLFLTPGIGEGSVVLDKVTVKGRTFVAGGGSNSITITDSTLGDIAVNDPYGRVRLVASGSTGTGPVSMYSGGVLTENQLTGSGFTDVDVPNEGTLQQDLEFAGSFNRVFINRSLRVRMPSGLFASLEAGSGAGQAALEIGQKAVVNSFVAGAPVSVTGQGTIVTANVKVSGVTFEQKPGSMSLADGVSCTVGGKTVTASGGSTGGGGGGGGGGNSNLPTSVDNINQTVTLLDTYSLPTKVNAKLENGTTTEVAVTWNSSIVNTNKTGTTEYLGTVENYTPKVKLTLTVVPPTGTSITEAYQSGTTGADTSFGYRLAGETVVPTLQFQLRKDDGSQLSTGSGMSYIVGGANIVTMDQVDGEPFGLDVNEYSGYLNLPPGNYQVFVPAADGSWYRISLTTEAVEGVDSVSTPVKINDQDYTYSQWFPELTALVVKGAVYDADDGTVSLDVVFESGDQFTLTLPVEEIPLDGAQVSGDEWEQVLDIDDNGSLPGGAFRPIVVELQPQPSGPLNLRVLSDGVHDSDEYKLGTDATLDSSADTLAVNGKTYNVDWDPVIFYAEDKEFTPAQYVSGDLTTAAEIYNVVTLDWEDVEASSNFANVVYWGYEDQLISLVIYGSQLDAEAHYAVLKGFSTVDGEDALCLLTPDGKETTLCLSDSVSASVYSYVYNQNKPKKGEFIRYETNGDNEIAAIDILGYYGNLTNVDAVNADKEDLNLGFARMVRVSSSASSYIKGKIVAGDGTIADSETTFTVNSNTKYFNISDTGDLETASGVSYGDRILMLDTDDDGSTADYVVILQEN